MASPATKARAQGIAGLAPDGHGRIVQRQPLNGGRQSFKVAAVERKHACTRASRHMIRRQTQTSLTSLADSAFPWGEHHKSTVQLITLYPQPFHGSQFQCSAVLLSMPAKGNDNDCLDRQHLRSTPLPDHLVQSRRAQPNLALNLYAAVQTHVPAALAAPAMRGGAPAKTIDLAGRKPGSGSTGRFMRCSVSPTRAALVVLMPRMTYPTCPVCSCPVGVGSGARTPTCRVTWGSQRQARPVSQRAMAPSVSPCNPRRPHA